MLRTAVYIFVLLASPALAVTNDELQAKGCPISAFRSPQIERDAGGNFVVHIGADSITIAASSSVVLTPYESLGRAGTVVRQRGMVWLDPSDAEAGTRYAVKCLVPPVEVK